MIRVLPLILLLLLPLMSMAADLPNDLRFADSLAAEGDYYRAITEYKRFIFLQPASPLVPRARLSIARSLLSGKRWAEADASLETLLNLNPRSSEAATGRRLYADSAYDRGEFGLARERYLRLLDANPDPALFNYARFRIGWTYLEQDRPQKARENFTLLPNEQQRIILADLDRYEELPYKSPRLAGGLSALLPGAGQVYTGRMKQAALTFLLNGAFILGTIEAINNENYAVGGILAFFEVGWYGGNIYNAVNNAHKYNRRIRHDFRQRMRSHLNLRVGLLHQAPALSLQYRF